MTSYKKKFGFDKIGVALILKQKVTIEGCKMLKIHMIAPSISIKKH